MTVQEAIQSEKKVIRLGNAAFMTREKFVKEVRKFRLSGAWAITPQHHSTFSKWCRFAAPKMKIGWSTLQAYGSPNYMLHYTKNCKTWVRGSMTIFPEDAKVVRKACKLYALQNGFSMRNKPGEGEQDRHSPKKISLSRAAAEICKEFLSVVMLSRPVRRNYEVTTVN